jgi:hypothetical protein
VELESAQPVE